MAVEITHIRQSGGAGHESITHYEWRNPVTGAVDGSSKAAMVNWIDADGGRAFVGSGANRAEIGVVHPAQGQPYLRTYADGQWTNNLLSLPPF